MSNKSTKKPELKNYLNIHHYLEDLYQYRKATEDYFSYETWSYELDIKNRSFLRQIVVGRRSLSDNIARQISRKLNFQGIEEEYFFTLNEYSKARSQSQKNAFATKLMQILKSDYKEVEIADYHELVSNILYPKMQTLLSFKDIERTPENLASLLEIPQAQALEALQTLEKAQLAHPETDGQWTSLTRSFRISPNLGSASLLEYHEKSLKEAIRARHYPVQERRYQSLLLPLAPEEFERLLKEWKSFSEQTLHQFDSDNLEGRRLFQLNFNIYPISQTPQQLPCRTIERNDV